MMTEQAICHFITSSFADAQLVTADGNHFFLHGSDHQFPFATLVTSDLYDTESDLNRHGAYRLNIGLRRETFRALFGENETSNVFTVFNHLMPHPVYGSMFWVCILNPSDETFAEKLRPLLEEAYLKAAPRAQQD